MAAAPQPRGALTTHHLRRRRHLLLLIVLTVVAAATRAAASSAHTTAAAESPSPAAAAAAASTFLRARCATTLYPALCYDSLLPYAAEIQENPARLARVAADVAAARLRALSARVNDILRLRHGGGAEDSEPGEPEGGGDGGGRPSETAALRDCASTVSAAASLARQSSAELSKLEPDAAAAGTTSSSSSSSAAAAGGGVTTSRSRQARWEVSNAKTWLSAAMTDEGTCDDGLGEAAATASPAGEEVTAGVAAVKQYTSNALSLVNGIPL